MYNRKWKRIYNLNHKYLVQQILLGHFIFLKWFGSIIHWILTFTTSMIYHRSLHNTHHLTLFLLSCRLIRDTLRDILSCKCKNGMYDGSQLWSWLKNKSVLCMARSSSVRLYHLFRYRWYIEKVQSATGITFVVYI